MREVAKVPISAPISCLGSGRYVHSKDPRAHLFATALFISPTLRGGEDGCEVRRGGLYAGRLEQTGFWTDEGEAAYSDGGREARGKAGTWDRGEDWGGEPEAGAARPVGSGSAAKERWAGVLKLKRRQGQRCPVTIIRAVLRKEAGQEPRHFETGVENNLERRPGPKDGSGGGGSCGPGERGPDRSQGRGSGAPRAKGLPRPVRSSGQRGAERGRASHRGAGPRGRRHPPAGARPCVPEAAAWLPSTPGPSPTPRAGPRRTAGLQTPDPSAARRSDICSPRPQRLRSLPQVAPERAEGPARREEPSGACGPEGAARRPPSGRESSG